jgi:ribosome-binding factor A
MAGHQLRDIKRAQRETHMSREISSLLMKVALDEVALQGLYVSRVKLSADGGICTVFFADSAGQEAFHKKLGTLILYKPSIRTALAKILDKRYTPDLVFKFDELTEKQMKMEELFSRIATNDKPESSDDASSQDDAE